MARFDLHAVSPNPSPEQMVKICNEFLEAVQSSKLKTTCSPSNLTPDDDDLLVVAERLAGQILAQYQSLAEVSKATAAFCNQNSRLTDGVLTVFSYACVREHDALGVMLDEVCGLYRDRKDSMATNTITTRLQLPSLIGVPRPGLWASDGRLQYSPEAFSLMHGESMRRNIGEYFDEGLPGVQKILGDYPKMNSASRYLLDKDLANRVYRSVLAVDHPVRKALANRLDDVSDGRIRFQKLFSSVDDPTALHGFDERLHHAFEMVDLLHGEKRIKVLEAIPIWITRHLAGLGGGKNFFYQGDYAVANITRLFQRYGAYGLTITTLLAEGLSYASGTSDHKIIKDIIDDGLSSRGGDRMEVGQAVKQAALLALTDEFFLTLGLSEGDLINLHKRRPSDKIREVLMSSARGRDAVFSQDLGL